MAERAGHALPYAVIDAFVKRCGLKTCDRGPKQAKVVDTPNLLKMGVNSPVTARIYA
jgi:hypothetical protein